MLVHLLLLTVMMNLHFNLTDTQAREAEEEAILSAETFAKASKTVEDSAFILGNGDIVDTGSKEDQWGWVLDHSKETLMNTTFASSAGNHDEDKNSFIEHFNVKLPKVFQLRPFIHMTMKMLILLS